MFLRCMAALVGLALMGMAGTANAVVLIIDEGTGQLTGATGVPVGGAGSNFPNNSSSRNKRAA